MQAFSKKKAALVAISVDDAAESVALAKKLGLEFPLLSDPGMRVTTAYGLQDPGNETAWPAVFVLDADNRVVWRAIESSYKVRPTTKTVRAAIP